VTAEARRAILVIRRCIATDRYALTVHFNQRMQQRGLFWPDVVAAIEDPGEVRSGGVDNYGRPKWIVCGDAATGDQIEIVCAMELDERETEFITLYWEG